VARRVELTTACAAVEHWQGRHDDAHRRLTRAWQELPDPESPEAAALELELAADGLYTLDFDQSLHAGSAALATARKRDDMLLIASAAAVLALIQASAGRMQEARAHRDEAVQQLERLSDDELAPRLEALFYLGWAETYLDLYSDSLAHVERAIEVARATGAGQLLVPLMLVRGFPLQMQGRLVEALEMAETAVEVARLSGNPHYLYWALFEQGWAHYYLGDLDRAIASADESLSVDSRLLGGTLPSAGGGPGWVRACSQMELGRAEEARAAMRDIVRADLQVAVQRCFDLEVMALAEVALGDLDGAGKFAAEAEADAGRLGTNLSAALAARARAAVLLAEGDAGAAAASAAESVTAAGAIGAALQVAFARALHGRALAAAGDRVGAIAVLREAERELDSFGSVRVRDETRRELRKLGARVEPRGRATAEESGMGALTARELEIAELITDRMTNAQIAEKLFLSKKTIESHIRNLFMKLSAGSRVEVARIVEAERRAPDAA
jgi:ATP/maltotriose-dependent transcriptional regulator MalT